MILGNRDFALGESGSGAFAVEPRRGDKAVDAFADHIFDQRSSLFYAAGRVLKRESEKFAFSCSHEPGAKAVGLSLMPRLVAVEITVEKDFNSGVRPAAKALSEGRTGNDWSASPMIGHDQHREPITDERCKQIDELIDLALEPRRDIVDRC